MKGGRELLVPVVTIPDGGAQARGPVPPKVVVKTLPTLPPPPARPAAYSVRLPIPRLFQPACQLPTSTLPCYRLTTTSGTRFLMISITSKIQPLGVRRKATLRSPKPAEARTGSLIGTAPLAINFSTS